MSRTSIARVVVSSAVYSIDKPYDYKIPENLEASVKPGMRVVVPFGRGNKKSEGIVVSLAESSAFDKIKSIEYLLDEEPVLTMAQLKLAVWMHDRFFCTVYEAVHAMLPAGMWYKEGKRKVGDKTVKYAVLSVLREEALEISYRKRMRSPKQADILEFLAITGESSVNEVCYYTGAAKHSVTALERAGILRIESREVFRVPEYTSEKDVSEISLNYEQENAFSELSDLMASPKPEAALLFGITGSGKTAVYLKLIKLAVENGKTAIMLVPEISLTPQFVSIFASYFGNKIAVLHSSLGVGERYDTWKKIRSGNASVVIGTRSAVFAPVNNLGIIIIDEEQEYTYKSESSPRYHTREIAKFRCVQSGGLLLMGSATPAVDSMYKAQNGIYKLFRLTGRYNERQVPEVKIVDMKKELAAGNGSSISRALYDELKKNIEHGEQSILFINRRGTSNLVVCGECGHTFQCEHCSVSLTYHAANQRLMCHYCGYSIKVPDRCPECGGKLRFDGIGTQKVENELHELFPDTGILRMDTDTVSNIGSHEKILSEFTEKKVPILVGTQMIAKGLDIENVTLVGVISADQSLYVNNFRAHEHTFSLITQVIGRSGRGRKTGRAVIQSFTPSNEVILLASKQDYDEFYNHEIELRKLVGAPPIRELIAVTVTGENEPAVMKSCVKLKKSFMNYFRYFHNIELLGPVPASVSKINNKYRYRISISCENTKAVRDIISHVLRQFLKDSANRGVHVFADVDPYES